MRRHNERFRGICPLPLLLIMLFAALARPLPRTTALAASGHLVVIGGVRLTPKNPRVGETVLVSFRLRNETGTTVTIRRLVAGARGPNACGLGWNAPRADFPAVEDITLQPNHEYIYRQSRSFDRPGDYFVEPVMQDVQGRWGGIRPFPRVWFNVQDASGYVPPPECLIVEGGLHLSKDVARQGEEVEVEFRLRNNGTKTVTIRRLVAAARGPGGPTLGWSAPHADFPAVTDIVLAPDETYTYHQRRSFDAPGDYFVEPAFMDERGKWGGIWPWPRQKFLIVAHTESERQANTPTAPIPSPTPTPSVPKFQAVSIEMVSRPIVQYKPFSVTVTMQNQGAPLSTLSGFAGSIVLRDENGRLLQTYAFSDLLDNATFLPVASDPWRTYRLTVYGIRPNEQASKARVLQVFFRPPGVGQRGLVTVSREIEVEADREARTRCLAFISKKLALLPPAKYKKVVIAIKIMGATIHIKSQCRSTLCVAREVLDIALEFGKSAGVVLLHTLLDVTSLFDTKGGEDCYNLIMSR